MTINFNEALDAKMVNTLGVWKFIQGWAEASAEEQKPADTDDWEASFTEPRTCSLNPDECESCQ